jgi:hypothetical protein
MTTDTKASETARGSEEIAISIFQSLPIVNELSASESAELANAIQRDLARALNRLVEIDPEFSRAIDSGIFAPVIAAELALLITKQDEPNSLVIAELIGNVIEDMPSPERQTELKASATAFIDYVRHEFYTDPTIESYTAIRERQLSLLLRQAESHLSQSHYAAALEILDRASKLDPLSPSGRRLFDEAMKKFESSKKNLVFTKFTLTSSNPGVTELTPEYLADTVNPYLLAVVELQDVIDELHGRKTHAVIIKELSQNSPISVGLDGASEAIQTINDMVVPWRRKHAQTMARLTEQEKLVEIESKKAEVLEKRAHAEKERLELAKQREETEKLRLENDKLRIELHRAKVQLALEILNSIAPHFSEAEKIAYLVKLLPPLEVIAISELEISSAK